MKLVDLFSPINNRYYAQINEAQRPPRGQKKLKRTQSPQQATTPVVLEWDDLTPYQQWMVEEGRKTSIEMPETVQNGEPDA